jgi:hypothetical protein
MHMARALGLAVILDDRIAREEPKRMRFGISATAIRRNYVSAQRIRMTAPCTDHRWLTLLAGYTGASLKVL